MRRQSEIQQDDRWQMLLKRSQGSCAIFGKHDLVILRQPPLHLSSDFFVVVNDQEFGVHVY